MKHLLFLLFFTPLISFAQADKQETRFANGVQDSVPGTSLILKDFTVSFQKIYTSDLDKEELAAKIKLFLPTIKNFELKNTENQSTYQFSGRITNFLVNYSKFEGRYFTFSQDVIDYPIYANVLIQVKDRKYRVIVSEITFKSTRADSTRTAREITLDEEICDRYQRKFLTNNQPKKTAKYLDNDLATSFDINIYNKISKDF
ncbi:hypothetical protein [Pedobacter cryoconitis]|uniref:DUF4468 domain-containing protein n=1 Tax=Pedobacter cryoconitis TaxID=188932 RepID=A0A7X0MM12_9SPHI|nr:hypothetical protein [Pedobacter cryoconitis]MBB6501978.1 hypothetical protein [Pedobacter cryoconitis]